MAVFARMHDAAPRAEVYVGSAPPTLGRGGHAPPPPVPYKPAEVEVLLRLLETWVRGGLGDACTSGEPMPEWSAWQEQALGPLDREWVGAITSAVGGASPLLAPATGPLALHFIHHLLPRLPLLLGEGRATTFLCSACLHGFALPTLRSPTRADTPILVTTALRLLEGCVSLVPALLHPGGHPGGGHCQGHCQGYVCGIP